MKLQCPMNNFERYAVFPMTMYQKRKPAKLRFCGLFCGGTNKIPVEPMGFDRDTYGGLSATSDDFQILVTAHSIILFFRLPQSVIRRR